ncbi:hypothetical protein Tcan_02865 [Toxocara canis]|uniref:Uncharacterized protein n=1 Tax=Toxocara canis TaxID=6265 RepID=A0A0B2VAD8_TOXCA|nr:hypothetical protein Tcan_02865 [Toxocara canis]
MESLTDTLFTDVALDEHLSRRKKQLPSTLRSDDEREVLINREPIEHHEGELRLSDDASVNVLCRTQGHVGVVILVPMSAGRLPPA